MHPYSVRTSHFLHCTPIHDASWADSTAPALVAVFISSENLNGSWSCLVCSFHLLLLCIMRVCLAQCMALQRGNSWYIRNECASNVHRPPSYFMPLRTHNQFTVLVRQPAKIYGPQLQCSTTTSDCSDAGNQFSIAFLPISKMPFIQNKRLSSCALPLPLSPPRNVNINMDNPSYTISIDRTSHIALCNSIGPNIGERGHHINNNCISFF